MKFVDPKTDIAFKKIFGNEAHKFVLIEFLNEVLELEFPIADVAISNTYQPPRLEGLKETTLDIKAEDASGRHFLVEMQVEKEIAFYKRALYYSSKAYSQQLSVGEKYHLLMPVIFLGILDFKVFDHLNPISRHLILNAETKEHELKDLEFNFIELPKFTKQEAELVSAADKWIYFLKQANELDHIPDNTDTPALQQAYQIANQHQWTAQELDIYIDQGIRLGQTRNIIETARAEGLEQGLEQGLEHGAELAKLEIARNLLLIMSDAEIASITGLAIETIAQLRS